MRWWLCPGCGDIQYAHVGSSCRSCGVRLDQAVAFDDALSLALDHPDPGVAAHAARLLAARMPPNATTALRQRARRPGAPAVLAAVAEALGALRDDGSVRELAEMSRTGWLEARCAAVEALAAIGSAAAQVALRDAASDPSEVVRRLARDRLRPLEAP